MVCNIWLVLCVLLLHIISCPFFSFHSVPQFLSTWCHCHLWSIKVSVLWPCSLSLSLSLSLSAQILKYKHNYWSKNFTATAKLQILMQLFMCFIVCHEEKVVNFYEINRHLIGKSQFIMWNNCDLICKLQFSNL